MKLSLAAWLPSQSDSSQAAAHLQREQAETRLVGEPWLVTSAIRRSWNGETPADLAIRLGARSLDMERTSPVNPRCTDGRSGSRGNRGR